MLKPNHTQQHHTECKLQSSHYDECEKYFFPFADFLSVKQYQGSAWMCQRCVKSFMEKNMDRIINKVNTGDHELMVRLAFTYEWHDNIDLRNKYYLLAIEKNNQIAISNYANIHFNNEQYDIAEKYYMIGANKGFPMPIVDWCNNTSPQEVYCKVENKQLLCSVLKNFSSIYYHMLQDFIDNSSDEICDICFLNLRCVTENDKHICGVCIGNDKEQKWYKRIKIVSFNSSFWS